MALTCMSSAKEAGSTERAWGVQHTRQHLPCARMHRQQADNRHDTQVLGQLHCTKLCQQLPNSGTQDTGPSAAHVEQAVRHTLLIDKKGEGPWLGNEVASLQDGSFFLTLLPPLRPCRLLSPNTRPPADGWAQLVQGLPRICHTQLWPNQVILASLKLTKPKSGGNFKKQKQKQKTSLTLKPSSPQEETLLVVVWFGF